jgi:hypothetical protein
MEYYERMVCVHRPHKQAKKKERKKLDDKKIDENPGKIP